MFAVLCCQELALKLSPASTARSGHGPLQPAASRRAATGEWPPRNSRDFSSQSCAQVWERESAIFARHTTPSLEAYACETATVMRELDMASGAAPREPGQAGAAGRAPRPAPLSRRVLRAASANVQRLAGVVRLSSFHKRSQSPDGRATPDWPVENAVRLFRQPLSAALRCGGRSSDMQPAQPAPASPPRGATGRIQGRCSVCREEPRAGHAARCMPKGADTLAARSFLCLSLSLASARMEQSKEIAWR